MANKRMFNIRIVDSDAFLEMPLSAQCLYFHLNMRADDDGFVDSPNKIIKIVGASPDDLKLLIAKSFLLCFENGVIVIKHWRMHNTLSQNRYHETTYIDEKSMLLIKDNGSYSLNNGKPIDDSKLIYSANRQTDKRRTIDGQKTDADIGLDIDKDKDKDIKEKEIDKSISQKKSTTKKFVPPTLEEVKAYCDDVGSQIDADMFVSFYESKGWMVGKNKMVSWKSAISTWERSKGLKRIPKKKVQEKPQINNDEEISDEEWLRSMEETYGKDQRSMSEDV